MPPSRPSSRAELELDGSIWFRAGAAPLGGSSRIELLASIRELGSITAAAKAVGMSYKAAWDAIDTMNNLAGEPLVHRAAGGRGGGGTRLTSRGERLVDTFRLLAQEHRRFVERLGRESERLAGDLTLMRRFMLRTSARNTLAGTVAEIRRGAVNDEVLLTLAGGQTVAATVTHESVHTLGLEPGAHALALVKASSVIVGVPGTGLRLSARNQLPATVARVTPGAVNTEVTMDLESAGTMAAVITLESAKALALQPGARVVAIFKASSVILGTLD